jgi:hypothetical protein
MAQSFVVYTEPFNVFTKSFYLKMETWFQPFNVYTQLFDVYNKSFDVKIETGERAQSFYVKYSVI